MNAKSWVIIQDVKQWRIGQPSTEKPIIHDAALPEEITPDTVAEVVAKILQSLGYAGGGILLAVGSKLCLAAQVPIDGPTMLRQHQTMMFQLEQYVPVAAEDFVGDFIAHGQEVALGVAMPFTEEKLLVDALENCGVIVQSITPTALLALKHLVCTTSGEKNPQIVLWQDGDSLELFQLVGGKPLLWRLLPAEAELMTRHLQILALGTVEPLRVTVHHLAPELLKIITSLPNFELQEADDQILSEVAILAAEEYFNGKEPLWIELRRDALGSSDPYRPIRGAMHWVTCAVAIFLIALILGWSYRAYQFDKLVTQNQEQQTAVFNEALPGQPVPAGIRSRLESEYAKISGLKGESAQLPQQCSAMRVLHDVLASLPNDTRYKFRELRFDRNRAMLDGEVRAHGDADVVANGLRKQGFQVQPPRTQQLPGQGVSIRITAERDSKESNKTGGGA
jgi:hypothetical protein